MKKRSFHFYSNLTNQVIEAGESIRFPALLLSIAVKSSPLRSEAAKVKARGVKLIADNGNASAIFGLIDLFAAEARRLDAAWRAATPAKRATKVRDQYREFASVVRNSCLSMIADTDVRAMLAAQRSFRPSIFICHEDYTLPVLLALGVDPERLGYPKAYYVGQQLFGIEQAARTFRGDFGPFEGLPYTTLHATDYDTAYEAGYYAGLEKGAGGIAVGVAGFMNDRAFISSYPLRGESIEVAGGKSIPRRYLRTLQVAVGLRDGFRDSSGRAPNFHALGLGSPIMLSLLALALDDVPALSVDSTSPIKNANMGKIMQDDPAYANDTIEGVANAMLSNGYRWTHRCVFCKAFVKAHPFRYDEAAAFHKKALKGRRIRKDDLAKKDGVGKYLSFMYDLSALAGSPLRKELHLARIGHNHAVLLELSEALNRRRSSKVRLRKFALGVCADYRRTAERNYPPYALQIDECLRFMELAKGVMRPRNPLIKTKAVTRAELRQIASGPAAAVVGLEKTAIVAAVGAFVSSKAKDRTALARLSAAAWRAMEAAASAADSEVVGPPGSRSVSPDSFPTLGALMADLRAYADIVEPLAMTGAFLVTPGGDKAEASVEYRRDALRARLALIAVRERLLAFAEALDGKDVNRTVDYAVWEKRQKDVSRGRMPVWFTAALEAEGVAKNGRAQYAEWFMKYYRKRVKPQKLSYLFRISYYELRKAVQYISK